MGSSVIDEADRFIDAVNKIELENNAAMRSREQLMESVKQIREENKENSELYDITTHAIEILKQLSDTAVQDAYKFIEASINDALEKMLEVQQDRSRSTSILGRKNILSLRSSCMLETA